MKKININNNRCHPSEKEKEAARPEKLSWTNRLWIWKMIVQISRRPPHTIDQHKSLRT